WCRTSRVEPVHLRTSSEQPVGCGGTSDAPHRTPDRLLSAMRREFGGHAELLARGIEASRCLQRLCNVAVTLSVGLRRPRDGRLRRLLLPGLLREPCLPCAPCRFTTRQRSRSVAVGPGLIGSFGSSAAWRPPPFWLQDLSP